MGEADKQPRVRMDAETRRSLLLEAAAVSFAEHGFAQSGLAEIAQRAGVSKTLLYHYFPDGRPQLYREVMNTLVADLVGRLRTALRAPVSIERRLQGLVEGFLGFFGDEPAAFRLLILEPWGSGDAGIVGQAMAIRVRIAAELNGLLSGSGQPVARTQAASAATVGCLLQVTELWMAGQVDRDEAVATVNEFVRGGLTAMGLLA
jgi:AcrR family transcriptional regulator